MQEVSRIWERQRRDSPLDCPERNKPYKRPDLCTVGPIQTSDLQNYKIINLCCFKPLHVWQFITAALGNRVAKVKGSSFLYVISNRSSFYM